VPERQRHYCFYTGARQAGIIPVILSGGSGTRLWPVSRESFPKQFWGLLNHGRSMIVETALRGHGPGFAAPTVMSNNLQSTELNAEPSRGLVGINPHLVSGAIG